MPIVSAKLMVMLIMTSITPGLSHSTGAPAESCSDFSPQHGGNEDSTSNVPVELSMKPFENPFIPPTHDEALNYTYSYTPSTTYYMTLQVLPALSNASCLSFRGFLIQARSVVNGTGVGEFVNNSREGDYKLSSCDPPNSGVTHTDSSLKTNVTVTWISPPENTGPVILRFSIVKNFSTFWSSISTTTIMERKCSFDSLTPYYCPIAMSCVEECPRGWIGSLRESGVCHEPSTAVNLAFNIDVYHFMLGNAVPLENQVVMEFTLLVRKLFDISIDLFQLTYTLQSSTGCYFSFSNGLQQNHVTLLQLENLNDNFYILRDAIHIVNTASISLDECLIHLYAHVQTLISNTAGTAYAVAVHHSRSSVCDSVQCMNGGTCMETVTSDGYVCNCQPDYSGILCSDVINNCLTPTMINCHNGTCVDSNGTFHCECDIGFTGDRCETNVDDCRLSPCINGACVQLSDASRCQCYPGWTGTSCSTFVNHCTGEPFTGPCNSEGTIICINGNSSFSCWCIDGFTGTLCEVDINDCVSNPCGNGGTCTDKRYGQVHCECAVGYNGTYCEHEVSACAAMPCHNGGTCNNFGNGVNYTCHCTDRFRGRNCEIYASFCHSHECQNNGTCNNNTNTCTCIQGFTGILCEEAILNCSDTYCMNGGMCVQEDDQTIHCSCLAGFSGHLCEYDMDYCPPDYCMNNGICIEGVGNATSCNCLSGYQGDRCETIQTVCSETLCVNGECIHDNLTARCNCMDGFTGENCEAEIIICSDFTCYNDGTCMESTGEFSHCTCPSGFSGNHCETDLDFCSQFSCQNGGTCMEDIGEAVICNCTEGFSGNECEIDEEFCTQLSCVNGGTCIEGSGKTIHCICPQGFQGDFCETDNDYCNSTYCLNGGTCLEDRGTAVSCHCAGGYVGVRCETNRNYCNPFICLNGGTCVEDVGMSVSCICDLGFSGDRCERDDSFCNIDTCRNGGTCVEDVGILTICHCMNGFEGESCEIDVDTYCENNSCTHNGTCEEGVGNLTTCVCPSRYTGDKCEIDLCSDLNCTNGECFKHSDSTRYICKCDIGYYGDNCDLATLTEIISYSNSCIYNVCQNGGICSNRSGIWSCDCLKYWSGVTCDECMLSGCRHCRYDSEANATSCICPESSSNCDCRIENCLKCSNSEVSCSECEVSFTLNSMNTTCLRKTESWSAGFISMVIAIVLLTTISISILTFTMLVLFLQWHMKKKESAPIGISSFVCSNSTVEADGSPQEDNIA